MSLHLPGFHWNQQDFMKSTVFHTISLNHQDSIMDFTVDFICGVYGVYMKSTWFHMKDQEKVKNLTWINCSYWFQVDFTWNLPDFMTKVHWPGMAMPMFLLFGSHGPWVTAWHSPADRNIHWAKAGFKITKIKICMFLSLFILWIVG